MIDYAFLFADETAARVDPIVGSYYTNGWHMDVCNPGVIWHSTQALTGWMIIISTESTNAKLDSHPNTILVLDRSQAANNAPFIKASPGMTTVGAGSLSFSPASNGAQYPTPLGKPPAQAQAAGFTQQTFNSSFSAAKFDMSGSYRSGYEWYLFDFFTYQPTSDGLLFNVDGSLTIQGPGQSVGNGQISTAAMVGRLGNEWVGTAFGGGGYFEATFKFDPNTVNTANGVPAFWSMAIEHLAGLAGQQWAGQAAGYSHFIEIDFFEYNIAQNEGQNWYTQTYHDWYGIQNVTVPHGYADASNQGSNGRIAPIGIDWNQYHKIGFLWVPATANTLGSAAAYLDDRQMGPAKTWTQFTGQDPPPGPGAAWTYGVIDNQHLVMILGTGVNEPLTVQSVKVWQASEAGNLVQ